MTLQTLDQAQLPHIQRLGLDYRADDRMKGLAVGEGMDAVRAISQLDDSIASSRFHRRNLKRGLLLVAPQPG